MSRVLSFSYRFGPPPKRTTGHTLWLDARCVANPYRHGESDDEIRAGVLRDPGARRLVERGVQYLTEVPDGAVFVGCSYGRHRSVAIADEIARRFGTAATHTSRGSNGKPS